MEEKQVFGMWQDADEGKHYSTRMTVMAQKNATQAIALAEKGIRWTNDAKAVECFEGIIALLKPTDQREEKLEPSVKRAAKKAAKK